MRHRLVVAVSALAPLLLLAASANKSSRAQARSSIDGVWEYMNPGVRGQAFLFNGHCVFFSMPADTTHSSRTLTDSLRVALFNGLSFTAGRFTVRDTFVTSTIEYAKNPASIGTPVRWTFSLKGDTCDYRVQNDSGRVTGSGRARRIAR